MRVLCPNGHGPLVRERISKGVVFRCKTCGGEGWNLALVRRLHGADVAKRLWRLARVAPPRGALCPVCRHPSAEITFRAPDGPLVLDLCPACQFVWFDPGEREALPIEMPKEEALPEEAGPLLAAARLRAERARPDSGFGVGAPDSLWLWIPGLLGFPVEIDPPTRMRGFPVVTVALCVAIGVVTVLSLPNLPDIVRRFGFVPADPWRMGGLTLLTAFFVHAGWIHALGNVWFLQAFGDNVEDDLGRGRFVLLVLVSSAIGFLLHALLDPRADVPVVGASAGISGVTLAYALLHPRSRIGLLFFLVFWGHVPAWFGAIVWVGLQAFLAVAQLKGASSVSAIGHIGGAAAGLLLAWHFSQWGRARAAERGAIREAA